MLNAMERFIIIFEKSKLSMSKFATILGKDRRTLLSWIENSDKKSPSDEVKSLICSHFRYSKDIWDCDESEFYRYIDGLDDGDLRLIDDGYENLLKYIYENENEGSLILHPTFPNPAYRDFVTSSVYKDFDSDEAAQYRKKRGLKMRAYSFGAAEWYSIKSLLEFCFANIGNFYTKEQKIQILELMIVTFRDNLNKSIYFFDSYDKKIYGLDMFYLSVNPKEKRMFLKLPLETAIVEIKNSDLVTKIHTHYTHAKKCPTHIDPKDAVMVMELILNSLKDNESLEQTCDKIDKFSPYGAIFKKAISRRV